MIVHSPHELALYAYNQRKKLKLNQTSVADLVGLQQKTISAFENKAESLQLNTLFLILSALNLQIRIETKDDVAHNKSKWQQEW